MSSGLDFTHETVNKFEIPCSSPLSWCTQPARQKTPCQAQMLHGSAISSRTATASAKRGYTARCARPLCPTLSTPLACTGRRLVHKTSRPRSTSWRSLQVYLIACASSTTSASSPTTHASVPRHLLDKQSGPQNPLCYRTNNELKLCLTDHPRCRPAPCSQMTTYTFDLPA